MRYLIVAEADRDLKQLRSRLALTERLAVLLADTPEAHRTPPFPPRGPGQAVYCSAIALPLSEMIA